MHLKIEPKKVVDAYSTPIVQQTSFWSESEGAVGNGFPWAFDFSVRNSEIYTNVGGYAHTQGDFITFFQYLNTEDYIAYFPYGPEIGAFGREPRPFSGRVVRIAAFVPSEALRGPAL